MQLKLISEFTLFLPAVHSRFSIVQLSDFFTGVQGWAYARILFEKNKIMAKLST